MDQSYIALSIPVFFVLIIAEIVVSRRRGLTVYRTDDALIDLACGIGSQAWNALIKVGLAFGFIYIFDNYRIASLPSDSVWTWVASFVLVDFAYYWWHRWSHEINWLWAAHIVHHQSEDYNLAVALRQAWFTSITATPFYLPLALLGFHLGVIATTITFSTLYQFWIHTQLIDRMGPFELLFNAPMHHRVHHAINPQYLDKNYAAILIVWDRLFGTYIAEKEPVVYGLVKPLHSFNPIWVNFHHWVALFKIAGQTQHWRDKIAIFWQPPYWLPADLPQYPPPPEVTPQTFVRYSVPVSAPLRRYLLMQFLLVAAAVALLISRADHLSWPLRCSLALLIWLSLWTWGGLLESKPWRMYAESLRLVLVTVGVGVFVSPAWGAAAAVLCLSQGLWVRQAVKT